MKKILCAMIALALLCGAALAETVYVTITNGQGEFCMAYEPVEVSDVDGDDVLTVYDVLYCAHESSYPGGAAEGFGAEDMGYGPSLTKLWGEENGGSYGYYVNNASCDSLANPVDEGAHVQAYAYQDLENWSDQFSYFEGGVTADGSVTLTLSAVGFDADWNPVSSPVAGAAVIVDGEDSGLVTDENGQVTIPLSDEDELGVHVVTATSADAVLVPPVFVYAVTE